MCVYSVARENTRPAKVGESIMVCQFTHARGFSPAIEEGVAACVLPGSTLVFTRPIQYHGKAGFLRGFFFLQGKLRTTKYTTAKLVEVGQGDVYHKDALEFPNGERVLLNDLRLHQYAYVQDPGIKRLMDNALKGAAKAHSGATAAPATSEGWLAPAR